jgi:predicted transcriptional regulator of viral defense system
MKTKEIKKHFSERPFFKARDVVAAFGKKASRGYVSLILSNLVKKGGLNRIGRGVYTFLNDSSASGFAFSPFYYGLQDALSIRGIWEQETNPVIITPRKTRQGTRQVMGTNVIVRRISPKMFFGYDIVQYHGIAVPVSDLEKTVIDFVCFREPIHPDVILEMKKRLRKDVLESYLKKVNWKTRKTVENLLKA